MKTCAAILRRFTANEDGTTAVEFGLIAIGFLTIVFGIIEAGRLFMAWNGFQYAFENASRVALVDSDLTEDDIEDMILEQIEITGAGEEDVEIVVTFPELNGVEFVQIEGTYTHEVIVPLLPESWSSMQLTAKSRLPRPGS